MTRKQKIYCKIGQAVCEGLGCMVVGGIFLTMLLMYIF